MSRRRQKKDESRAAARQRRQEQAERTRAQVPVMAGGFAIENTSDNRLLAKAVRQRWAIPDAVFRAVPDAMKTILEKGSSERNRIMAAKTLAVIHGQNEAATSEVEKREQPPTPVNVNVQVNMPNSIANAPDERLIEFIHATGSVEGNGVAQVSATSVANGVLPALATPSTNGVSGKH